MLDKLRQIEEKYVEIENKMATPEVYTDPSVYAKYAKEQKELTPVVEAYRRYTGFEAVANEARESAINSSSNRRERYCNSPRQ